MLYLGIMIKVIHDDICMYDIGLSMRNPVKKKLIATGTKRFQAISKWSRTALSRHKLGDLGTTMTMMIAKMMVISWRMNRVMVVVVKMRMWF